MYANAWKHYIWNPSKCICENDEYLTSSSDNSVIISDEIVNAADSVSKNASVNVMSTVLTNFHKMDCYILCTVSAVINCYYLLLSLNRT